MSSRGHAQQGVADSAQSLPWTEGRVKVSWKENILATGLQSPGALPVPMTRGRKNYLSLRTSLEGLRHGVCSQEGRMRSLDLSQDSVLWLYVGTVLVLATAE